MMKIKYTSSKLRTQIYIGSVNWMLLFAVLLMILIFESSENLSAAYGLAVTATMTISAIFMVWIFWNKKSKLKFFLSIFVLTFDLIYLVSVFTKIPAGGYWSLVIAALITILIQIWIQGSDRLRKKFRSLDLDIFITSFEQLYSTEPTLKGEAIYFARVLDKVPPYVVHVTLRSGIIYEKNILFAVETSDVPYGINFSELKEYTKGLYGLSVTVGYLEVPDLLKLFKLDGIKHITLTTGTQGDSLAEFTHLASCCAVLKSTTSLPIHVQVLPPKDRGMLAMLKEAGADTIGMHIESFDTTVLTQVAPCKAEIGRGHFISRWEEAVSLFGRNQVSSFIIAGLGESRKSIVEGSRLLCELGVYPFIVPLWPIPGTLLAEHLPPDPLVMIGIYEQVASLLHAVGLSWKKSTAGCVRCGASGRRRTRSSSRPIPVFAPLLRISAAGGSARPLTTLDASRGEMSHRWPSLVTGANAVLLTVKTEGLQSFDDARVAVVSLAGGAPRAVLDGGTAASYSPSGHVVYARAGALLAVPFDAARLQVTGAPFTVLEAVSRSSATGSAHYALSRSGTLVSLPGSVDIDNRARVRVDADGRVETLTHEVRPYGTVRTSPDGRRLAMWIGVANDEIWTFEIECGILTRLAQGAYNPVWSPDGQWVVYTIAGVQADVVRSRADGSGQPEVLLPRKRSDGDQLATAISPDGRLLAFTEDDAATGSDLWTLSLADRSRKLVLATRFNEQAAEFSPDGRALAFVSDETSRSEVYVQPFPGPGARRQVSVGGGWAPVWGRTAGEIFYQSGTSLMGVSLGAAGFEPATPREVLRGVLMFDPTTLGDMVAPWGLGPGGRGFVMPQQLDQKQATRLTVDLNWAPEPSR